MLFIKKHDGAVMIKKLVSIFLAAVLLFCISGCSRKQAYPPITDVNDLGGRRVGVNLVWSADYKLSGREDMTLVRYNTVANLVMLCATGRLTLLQPSAPLRTKLLTA